MMNKILFLLLLPIAAWAGKLPEQLAVPGGIVKIGVGEGHTNAPKVFYDGKRVLVTKDEQSWLALVGVPLSAKPGQHSLQVIGNNEERNLKFNIADKEYPAQHLTITKKRMVTGFTEADLKRIEADKIEMTKAKAVWSEGPIDADFVAPVDGRLSSLFGLKRYFNEIPKNPHNGLDIAAPTGTPILAPASGKVINTGNYYFNGNTVFLDHGQGLLSAYLHMNEITVKPGDVVKQGDPLGTVGETGRVTGPHLHWIVYLNHTPVDPALFISQDIVRLDARNKK
ncbi:peptidoglycan DD-metalloendopeptidase family protein [Methylomarinum vadi]|uniref:peptidoglycan DD-metalloendopeptidase family protein n=1 Tax=Methylomarinum vadi TaxID=438855 RepID=UPI001269164A|nr:peptidoglycan DD-metalloendopeptidase family protein [Methylomarinum vadi]